MTPEQAAAINRLKERSLLSKARSQTNDFMNYRPHGQSVSVGDMAKFGINATPFVGDSIALEDAKTDYGKGNYGSAALNALSTLPAIGDAATALKVSLPALGSLGALWKLMGRNIDKIPSTGMARQAGAIGAWHGSPHKFGKFSMKHLGSGEGAQAYGHGLYFAESPDVARSYQGVGETIGGVDAEDVLLTRMEKAQDAGRYDEAQALEDLLINRSPANVRKRFTKENGYSDEMVEAANKIADELQDQFKESHLYHVEIEWPEDQLKAGKSPMSDDDLLDLDKPLSEQSEKIKDKIEAAKWLIDQNVGDEVVGAETGAELYRDLTMAVNKGKISNINQLSQPRYQQEASKFLNELGIPGARYLDQMSRSSGQGSANYVMYDDKLINILSRD